MDLLIEDTIDEGMGDVYGHHVVVLKCGPREDEMHSGEVDGGSEDLGRSQGTGRSPA